MTLSPSYLVVNWTVFTIYIYVVMAKFEERLHQYGSKLLLQFADQQLQKPTW